MPNRKVVLVAARNLMIGDSIVVSDGSNKTIKSIEQSDVRRGGKGLQMAPALNLIMSDDQEVLSNPDVKWPKNV